MQLESSGGPGCSWVMEDSVEKSDDVPNQNDKNSPKTKIEGVCEIVSMVSHREVLQI